MYAALAGLALSAAGNIAGAVMSARKAKEGQNILNQQHADNVAWYNRRYNSDYTQRSDYQAMLSRMRDTLSEQYRRARATNKVAGGTDEGLAMLQNSANQALANATSSIASNASAYKDSIDNARNNEANQYANTMNSIRQAEAQRNAVAGQTMGNTGASIIETDTNTWKDDAENWGWLIKKNR